MLIDGCNRLPVASGLNVKWASTSKSKSTKAKATVETAKRMDDEAALSTRPDFPPSPEKFDREGANYQLARANKRDPSRKNKVCHSTL
jgi:hypothetical protein